MNEERNDGEIWDEHMWEAHINRMEKKSEQFRKFIESKPDDDLPRWLSLLNENKDKFDAVDAFIAEELETEDEWFFDDFEDDQNNDWPGEEDDAWFEDFDEDDFYNDGFDEGEGWKELSDDFTFDENGSIENLEIYVRGRGLAVYVLKWADALGRDRQGEALSEFVSNTLVISAKLAGGYSFGFETEFIGGNIACTKKALNAANKALTVLESELKAKAFMSSREYRYLHRRLFELRNDIGVYIQELRERFNLGLD